MTVYIEYVLVDNFIIDYVILKATFTLTGKPVSQGRLLFCAFLGATFALAMPVLVVNGIVLTLIKICMGLLMVTLCAKYSCAKSFVKHGLTFFALTFLTGGVIIGTFSVLGLNPSSETSVALMFLPVLILGKVVMRVIRYFYRERHVRSYVYNVQLRLNDVTVKARGFMDTGNGLYHKNSPVVLVCLDVAKRFITNDNLKLKTQRITVDTVNGESQKIAFEIDEIVIYNGNEQNIYNNVTICVTEKGFSDGYQVILHPALFNGESNEKDYLQTKKIS